MPTCRVCQRDYVYDDEKGYDRELCSPMCDGIEAGRRGLHEALTLLEESSRLLRSPDCAVNYLTRHAQAEANDDFRARIGADPLKPLKEIAATRSADPVLANFEQGVRDGLAAAGKDSDATLP